MKKQVFSLSIMPRGSKWHNLLIAAIFWAATILFVTIKASAQPTISTLSTLSGNPGSAVTITGTGFNASPASNIVYFGATRAAVTTASATSLGVTVPAGATYAHVSVENTATSLTASSHLPFLPTFDHSAYPAGAIGFDHKVDFSLPAGASPGQTIIQDVDGDGKADMVVLTTAGIAIYLNTSISGIITGSSFSTPTILAYSSASVTGYMLYSVRLMAFGDIDGDGKPDIAFAKNNSSDSVYLSRNISTSGAVGFSLPVAFSAETTILGASTGSIAIADIDGDGRADVVVSTQDGNFSVFRNTATAGSITTSSLAAPSIIPLTGGYYAFNVLAGDIDGDGKPDLAFTSQATDIGVIRNTSTPGSISFGTMVTYATNAPSFVSLYDPMHIYTGQSVAITLIDIDGDGKQEIAVTNGVSHTISVFHNTATAGIIDAGTLASAVVFQSAFSASNIVAGDFDGDGKPDLAVSGATNFFFGGDGNIDQALYLYRNTSSPGTIDSSSLFAFSVVFGHNYQQGLVAGDIDGDGKPDLVTTNSNDSTLSVLRNAPVAPVVITSVSPLIAQPGTAATITGKNFNSTPSANIVYFGATRAPVTVASATSLSVTIPDGATYQKVTADNTATQRTGFSSSPFLPTFEDSSFVPGTVRFDRAVIFPDPASAYCRKPIISDLDGDGKADVVAVDENGFVVYRNTSTAGAVTSASFAAGINFTLAVPTSDPAICVGDIDGDGKPEVVVNSYIPLVTPGIVVYHNISSPGSVAFAAPVFFPTGATVSSMTIEDINGDGKADIVLGDFSIQMEVLMNNCSGTIDAEALTPPCIFPTYVSAYAGKAVAVGDIDDDGRKDVIMSDGINLWVFRGTLNGFNPAVLLNAGASGEDIQSVAVTDIDGDGKLDIAETNIYTSLITVFRNIAVRGIIDSSSFAPGVAFATGPNPTSIAVADVDGNGKPDLVVTNVTDLSISIFRNVSTPGIINSASFVAFRDTPAGQAPQYIAAGDIDGDGKADIVTTYISYPVPGSPGVGVLRNHPRDSVPAITGNTPVCVGGLRQLSDTLSGGTWTTASSAITLGSTGLVTALSAGTASITYTYLPGFIATTIVTVNPGSLSQITSVSPMKGNVASAVTITGTNFSTTTSEDVTYFGATKANVVSASGTVLNVTVPAGATYMPVSVTNPTCGLTAYAVQSFLQTYDNSPYMSGSVHLDPKVSFAGGNVPNAVILADFDGDGKADMAEVDFLGNSMMVHKNTSSAGSIGSSSFATPLVYPTGLVPYAMVAGDIDGDGKLDIVVVNAQDSTAGVYLNTSLGGSISFASPVPFRTGNGPQFLAIGDLDLDGRPDLLVGNYVDATFSVLHNASTVGHSSFEPQVVYGIPGLGAGFTVGGGVAIEDIDGDNKPDIIVVTQTDNSVSVWQNNSSVGTLNSGSFAAPVTFSVGSNPASVVVGDIDGDNKADLVVNNTLDNTFSVLRNTSSGSVITTSSFAPQVTFAAGNGALAIGDIDGDGKPDIAAVIMEDSTLAIFRNTATSGSITSGSLAAPVHFALGWQPYYMAIGDIDGDSKPDIVDIGGINTIEVLRNNPVPLSGIIGTPVLCVGDTATLSYFGGSGEWSSLAPGVAVVGSSTGIVTGVSAGTATIVFSGPLGFSTMQQITVNATPASISGTSPIEVGSTVALSDATAGGSWSSNPSAVATIDPSGTLTGVAAGSATITYALPDGCVATQTLNVNPAVVLPGSIQSGIVSTYAPFSPDYQIAALVVDSSNNIFVADGVTSTVKKISRSGVVTIVAGNGTAGYSGDGGLALSAQLNSPAGLAMDTHGNLYVADVSNYKVRKISTSGIITTVAGSTWGYSSGDGGPATAATFSDISYIAVDKRGNLYISDAENSNIRKVDTSGIISTIAGFPGAGAGPITGFSGDGGPATNALLNSPRHITVDVHQNVYFFDLFNHRIRKIDSMGSISTVAGNGSDGYNGDWGPATLASISWCAGLKTDPAGNIYLTGGMTPDHIRKINTAGIITTIAGDTTGYSGDGGPALLGSFDGMGPFEFDRYGNIFVADFNNHVIRQIKYHPDVFADSFSVFIDNHCGALNFSTETKPTLATALSTDFGDGTSATTALTAGDPGTMYASVPHVYSAPGTYSVKEILWNGATPIDSIVFTHQYLLCNNFAVQFYYDNNGNCMKDADESWSFSPLTIEIDSNGVAVDTQMATSGLYYSAFGSAGDIYSFKVVSAPPGFTPTCSGSGIVYDTLQSILYHVTNNYIGFICPGFAGFDFAEHNSFIAGRHSATGTIVVNNSFCVPQNAVVTLNIDPKYIFQSAVPAPTSVSGNTITWNLTGLYSLTPPLNISYTLDRPGTLGPWLIPGDTILTKISVSPISGDADTTNNTTIRIDTVKSSYDPNEICVIPDGDILPNTWLQYTISFENTGNDTARNIAVMDTLSDNLDINTLRLDAATAAMNIAIYNADGHNIVKFDFPSINLPDSTHHNQCNGMVIFHIRPKSGLTDGTTIFNHAGIFFDDNPVVLTDTAENVISLIHGPNSVCMGSKIVMTEVPELGIWTLSNAHAAVVDDTVTGVTAGVDTLTYTTTTKYGSSSVTKIVTVNVSPAPITGPSSVCTNSSISLTDATPAVSWSSSDMIVTVGSTGIVTGVAAGTATITCFPVSGCAATKVITVNPAPQSISGVASVCAGSSSSLSDATAGGTWSSSDPGVAIVGSSGIVSATTAGAAYISYALPSGCFATRIVTVSPLPAPISGSTGICTGNSSTLSDLTPGGSWSSNDPAVAAIFLGTVTSTFAGTAVISYIMPSGCMATKIVTANPSPVVISGTAPNCVGSSSMLSDFTTGGAWSSNNPAIATVGSAGLVAAISAGAAFISYTLPSGCFTVKVVTISPMPSAISGSPAGCVGAPSSLSDAVAGGTWSSNNTTVAVIGSGSGVLTGLSAGVTTITYALSPACSVTTPVTINPTPTSILGVTSACASGSTALSNTTGGGAWSSGNAAVATVGTAGIVTGVATGTTNISYTLGSGCSTNVVVTISPMPSVISGSPAICAGSSSSLSDAVTGGNWSSSNPAIAAVGFGTGVLTGVSTGTVNISYKMSPGCYVNTVVTINPLPNPINGVRTLCAWGGTTSLSDAISGGSWSSLDLTVGTTGVVIGAAPGTGTISYTLPTGCKTTAIVTVNILPSPISGITTICDGASSSLSDVTTGGTWSSSNPVIAAVGSGTGAVAGMSPGTANITYTLGTGCSISTPVTINSLPGGICGSHSLCAGASSSLTDLTVGGTWNSSNTAVATIGSTGMVNGIAAGTTNVTYTIASGCMTSTIVTVVPVPAPISSASTVCPGATIALSDVTAGGTWTASDPGIAVIAPGGLLTGIAAGTTIITYTAGTGCLAMKIVTVTPAPLPISGALTLCLSSTAVLTDATSGGTWASDNITIATVGSSSGIVFGGAAGTTVISYIAGGCATFSIVTVVPTPSPITGIAMECPGSSSTLSDATTGGNWSSASAAVGSVSPGGVVTGVSAGTTEITYTLPDGCYVTVINTVNPAPSGIVNPGDLCVGTSALLSSSPSGGSWISATPGIATVDAGGLVMAVATGTTGISYTLPGGCYAAVIVTVNSTPGIITGATTLCVGDNTDLNDAFAGGTWSSSTPGIATVATIGASTGVVIGIAPGVDTISYIVSAGCVAYSLVTVYPLPSVTATATTAGCGGKYDLTSAGALLYSWSPATGLSCTTCASNTVNPVATITYTVVGTSSFGCSASATATMNGNRILGHITAGGAPTDTMKVWLMQVNPADSSLIATDSMLTCMDGGAPYYEFDGMAAGKYMLRAKHLGSMPGATGYAPTYGASTPYWDTAISVSHAAATDTQHITMIHGAVLPGSGSISGLIISGAGRGTSGGAPAVGMLVYLLNSSDQVVTYTYTDATGAYSFSGLANGSYIVYPEDYKYYTTASALVTLTIDNETVTDINFKRHTSLGTITPYSNLMVSVVNTDNGIGIYPNPASGVLNVHWTKQATGNATVLITDLVGREVYNAAMDITTASGKAQLDISSLKEGVYIITIRSDSMSFNCKLVVQ